jgi:hypothetical protein
VSFFDRLKKPKKSKESVPVKKEVPRIAQQQPKESVPVKKEVPRIVRRPYGDDPLAHFDGKVIVNSTLEAVWQTFTSTAKWKLWYADIDDVKPGWTAGAEVH